MNAIDRRHVMFIAQATPNAMIGHGVNTIIATVAIYGLTSDAFTFVWGASSLLLALIVLVRSLTSRSATSVPASTPSRNAARRAVLFAIALSAPWSVLAIVVMGNFAGMSELIIACLVVGMSASGSIMLAPIRPAARVYMLCILVPTAINALFFLRAEGSVLLGCIAASYSFYLWGLIDSTHKLFCDRLDAIEQLGLSLAKVKSEHDKAVHAATHDSLTKLNNRRALTFKLREVIRQSQSNYGLIFVDIDGFSAINDARGHHAGDQLLKYISERMTNAMRPHDTIARLGGDEFAIIIEKLPTDKKIDKIAQRLMNTLANPYSLLGKQIDITFSIGAAQPINNQETIDDIMTMADLALSSAKQLGGGNVVVFDHELRERSSKERTLETDLKEAIIEQQFELYYQPIIDLKTNTIAGFEALIRWNHPTEGLVPPGIFLPFAERGDLILQIGNWVIADAFRQAALWPQPLFVSVNISPRQLRMSNLLGTFRKALADAQLDPARVHIEITETALLSDDENTRTFLESIRKMGVHIALDDFGTGYSSLSYLTSFPFDTIKIDRSFVSRITEDNVSCSIVRTVAQLASSIGYATIAEGIEEPEHAEQLRNFGVHFGQGYLFGRPTPVSDLAPMLLKANVANTPRKKFKNAAS